MADAGPAFEEVYAAADAGAGEKVFAKCKACHKVDGTDGTGPHLNGVVDRAKARSRALAIPKRFWQWPTKPGRPRI